MSSVEAAAAPAPVAHDRAEGLTRLLSSTPLLGSIVAWLSWPIASVIPRDGLDPGWVAGLYMAVDRGLHFGTQVVFTYGPLGFLQHPVLYDRQLWLIAFIYWSAIHVSLAVSLLWVARKAVPLPAAVALCYTLLVIGNLDAAVVLLAFIWCFESLAMRPPRLARPLVVLGGGALAGVELLGKANFGIAVFAFCALAVLGMKDARRNAPIFMAVALVTFSVCWFLTGQAAANLPEFASTSLQLISGYSRSMSTNVTYVGWQLPLAASAIALLALGTLAGARQDPPRRRLALFCLVLLFCLLDFKQGFVRQGLGGTPEFFALMLGAGIVVASRLSRQARTWRSRLSALALIAALAVLTIVTLSAPSLWESLNPRDHAAFLREDVNALISSGERERLVSIGRRSMRSTYGLDRRTLTILGQRRVAVDPSEIGVAWAYGLNWDPLPTMQDYTAYTPELDALDARALRDRNGPAAILRQPAPSVPGGSAGASVDGRYAGWDPPESQRAMLCNFRATRTTAHWQLLIRVPDRCGPPRAIATVHSETGRPIVVPAPPGRRFLVFAEVDGLGVHGWESLMASLYRAPERTAIVNGRHRWALVADTTPDGLIMRAAPGADFPGAGRLAPDARTIAFAVRGSAARPITVRFFAQRVDNVHPRRPSGCCATQPMFDLRR